MENKTTAPEQLTAKEIIQKTLEVLTVAKDQQQTWRNTLAERLAASPDPSSERILLNALITTMDGQPASLPADHPHYSDFQKFYRVVNPPYVDDDQGVGEMFSNFIDWVQTTVLVRVARSEKIEKWRRDLQNYHEQALAAGDSYNDAAIIIDALLALLDDKDPALPQQYAYSILIQWAQGEIQWLLRLTHQTFAVMTLYPDLRADWADTLAQEKQRAQLAANNDRAAFLHVVEMLVRNDVELELPDIFYQPFWELVRQDIAEFRNNQRIKTRDLTTYIARTFSTRVVSRAGLVDMEERKNADAWQAQLQRLQEIAAKRGHENEAAFFQALLDILLGRAVRGMLGNPYRRFVMDTQREIELIPIREAVSNYLQAESDEAARTLYIQYEEHLSSPAADGIMLQMIDSEDDPLIKMQIQRLLRFAQLARQAKMQAVYLAFMPQQLNEDDSTTLDD